MTMTRRSRLGGLLALALLAAACDTTTGPQIQETFDAQEALADYEALQAAMESSGFVGFQALAARSPFGRSSAAVAALRPLRDADDGRAFALELARQFAGAEAGPAGAPIISDRHRGATFVYDPATDDYVLDPDREGAPSTGVRFILYALDGAGIPIVEQETGYADLVDEGDGSAEDIVLHLTVVENGTTALDYRTRLDETNTGGTLSVEGYLQGDGVRLDFDIDAVGTDSGSRSTVDLTFDLRVDARDFSVTGSVRGVEEGVEGEGDIDVTVRHRSESIRVDVTGGGGLIEGTFYLNGDVFATVSGPEGDPTFTGADGQPLTGIQFLVLRHMLDTVEDVFDFLEDLVDPVDELVVLGIIL